MRIFNICSTSKPVLSKVAVKLTLMCSTKATAELDVFKSPFVSWYDWHAVWLLERHTIYPYVKEHGLLYLRLASWELIAVCGRLGQITADLCLHSNTKMTHYSKTQHMQHSAAQSHNYCEPFLCGIICQRPFHSSGEESSIHLFWESGKRC